MVNIDSGYDKRHTDKSWVVRLGVRLRVDLKELIMKDTCIGDAWAKALGPYLPKSLTRLDLGLNGIGDATKEALKEQFSKSPPGLRVCF